LFSTTSDGRKRDVRNQNSKSARLTGIIHALLGPRIRRSPWRRRKLEHGSLLTHRKSRQEHNLSIREFERIMMRVERLFVHLPEYRSTVLDGIAFPNKKIPLCHGYAARKGEFRSRKKAYGHVGRFGRSEAACPGTEVARREPVPDSGGAGANIL